MIRANTLLERRAVKFGMDLLMRYGYGYTIATPYRLLVKDVNAKGCNVSAPTALGYLNALVHMGYAKKTLPSPYAGATYTLNRYAFDKIIYGN